MCLKSEINIIELQHFMCIVTNLVYLRCTYTQRALKSLAYPSQTLLFDFNTSLGSVTADVPLKKAVAL